MSFEPLRESIAVSKEKKISVISCEVEVVLFQEENSTSSLLFAKAEMEDFSSFIEDGAIFIDANLKFDCVCSKESGEIDCFTQSAQRKETVKLPRIDSEYTVRYNLGEVKEVEKGVICCTVDFVVYETEQSKIEYVSPTSVGAFIKDSHQQYCTEVCKGEALTNLSFDEENFDGEIRYLNARCSIFDVSANDGYFVVDGEILCDVVIEGESVGVKTVSVPFNEECVCQCKGGDVIDVDCKINKIETERTGNDEGEKVILSFDLCFNYTVERVQEFIYVSDAFCLDCALLPTVCSNRVCVDRKNAYIKDKIDFTFALNDSVVDEILGACDFCLAVSQSKIENGKLYVDGLIEGKVLCCNENGIFTIPISYPYSSSVKTCLDCDEIDVSASIGEVGAKLRRGSEIAISCELTYCVKCEKVESFAIISDFALGDEIEESNGILSIVIGKEGETLFDVARVACCDPALVTSLNPEVKFPLLGGERIIVFK